jgi:ketosteroid isomerase-like protein
MSQENVEIVRLGFDAWEHGDFGAHLRLVHQDIVCARVAPLINPKTYHGYWRAPVRLAPRVGQALGVCGFRSRQAGL